MIEILIPDSELYDEEKEEYVEIKQTKLQLEHSLISLKKWESKWHIPFINKKKEHTYPELMDYIYCMTLNRVDPNCYLFLTNDDLIKIVDYIDNPMTATKFYNDNGLIGASKSKEEIVTAEIIYYWMISLNIPVEFEKWHLGQLLTLIKVINIKNQSKDSIDKKQAATQRAAMNKARRAKYHTKG